MVVFIRQQELLSWHRSSAGCLSAGGGAAADVTAWCEFHNGVAAGIKVAPRRNKRLANKQQRLQQGHQQRHQQQYPAGSDGCSFGRDVDPENPLADAWLPHSKPAVPNYAHAGVLLALGLTGHLDRLSWAELYRSVAMTRQQIPMCKQMLIIGDAAEAHAFVGTSSVVL